MWGFVVLFVVGAVLVKMMRDVELANRYATDQQRKRELQAYSSRKYLESVDPRKFEYLVADVFRDMGWQAEVTQVSADGGKDIILRRGDEVKYVEVKRYAKTTIGRPLIQKLHSAITDAGAHGGYFVTLSQFNANARAYAARNNIELIDGNELTRLMNA